MNQKERHHELQIEIAATPAQVWEAVSTAEGIASWFAPIAKVEPGQGGTVTFGWSPEMVASNNIEIWEPEHHLRLTSERPEGKPPNVVDYFIEGQGGTTVMRLVHSGFGADASFDNEFDSTGRAWLLFLKMMKHSTEHGVASCRNVTLFRMIEKPREEGWAALLGPKGLCAEGTLADTKPGDAVRVRTASGEVLEGIVRHFDPRGLCALELPEHRHAMLNLFCEACGGSTMLTITWQIFGASTEDADQLRDRWLALLDRCYGVAVAAS